MAEFYGTLTGNRETVATKTGSKKSGIRASVQNWDGSIIIELYKDSNDKLCVRVDVAYGESSSVGDRIFMGTFEEFCGRF